MRKTVTGPGINLNAIKPRLHVAKNQQVLGD
ncbi:Uncharacterised protein [Serratia plymuthica]|nr:Uncharacterised protein [Serratia plymuthica]VEI17326.1 Uncharacterised protein [Serratia plymuthica]